MIYDFCRQQMQTRHVGDDSNASAHGVLGETQLVELVATIANYTLRRHPAQNITVLTP